jgi:hypothetical protein
MGQDCQKEDLKESPTIQCKHQQKIFEELKKNMNHQQYAYFNGNLTKEETGFQVGSGPTPSESWFSQLGIIFLFTFF